jgi:hypothetical protein
MYSSTAKSRCTLCDIEIIATCEGITANVAEIDAINKLKNKLDHHFDTKEHYRNVKRMNELREAEFKDYNSSMTKYLNDW